MRRRAPPIPQRTRIFAGCEGDSERGLLAWLQRLANKPSRLLHLDIVPLGRGAGSPQALLAKALAEKRRRGALHGVYRRSFLLLDADRLQGGAAEADLRRAAEASGLSVILQQPSLEGLLVRLHPGHEARTASTVDAERELQRLWPDYEKPEPADRLARHFTLDDLHRAARHDGELHFLLKLLGLLPPP